MLEQFHFLQPLWLLALLPILPLIWFAFRQSGNSKSWEKVIDPNLLPFLLHANGHSTSKIAKILLAAGWAIAVIALADPVWEKVSRPVFQTKAARVIVLDLSNSMLIDDLKPSRLARARFKIEDILSRKEEGQTALVLFAGDAFTAAPLTRDTETIRSLLKILSPQLMPVQGSRVDLGLRKAHELLKQSGSSKGQVLLIADGDSMHQATLDAVNELKADGHQVSVLGVGTEEGGYLKFRNNKNVKVALETDNLNDIALQGGGFYHAITTNNADLQTVLKKMDSQSDIIQDTQKQEINNEEWKSTGPLLILLLLPIAALAFRRGWLLNLLACTTLVLVVGQNQIVYAAPVDSAWKNLWSSLSQNKEQQAQSALQAQNYESVESLSNNSMRLGSAAYKLENYQKALEQFQLEEGADARYNQANSLAKLKKYQEAIAQYDEALKIDPNMKDAIENKKIIEEFLKKQQEQQASQKQQQNQESQSEQQASNENPEDDSNGDSGQQSGSENNKKQQQAKNQEQQNSASENQFSDANKALENKNKQDEGSKQQKKEGDENKQQQGSMAQQESEGEGHDENVEAQEQAVNKDIEKQKKEQAEKQNAQLKGTNQQADALSEEEQMAAEQWLRRIPDDPGGLLRRKFRSQYNQRRQFRTTEQPW